MFGRTAKTAAKTRTGRKAGKAAARGFLKVGGSRGSREATTSGIRGLGRLAKTGVKLKAGKEAGRVGTKGAAKAGKGFGKLASRKGKREIRVAEKTLRSERSGGSRFLRYGLLALLGLGLGALLGRSSGGQSSPSFTDTTGPHQPESGSPAAERGQTAGSGTPVGEARDSAAAGGAAADDADRAKSDPSSGPLVGESHREDIEGVTEDQPEVENRIRTRIGEDERTRDIPRVNVEVNDGVAELRGVAPSEEAKEAAGEIAAEIEGVREVRNLIEVSS